MNSNKEHISFSELKGKWSIILKSWGTESNQYSILSDYSTCGSVNVRKDDCDIQSRNNSFEHWLESHPDRAYLASYSITEICSKLYEFLHKIYFVYDRNSIYHAGRRWTAEQGPQGPQGLIGERGTKGDTGERGFQGSQGPRGFQGPQGFQGTTGSQGPQGPKGEDSTVQGPTGPQGPRGASITIKPNKESCKNVNEAYIDENGDIQILVSLPDTFENGGKIQGPQGPVGPQGPQGLKGDDGINGTDGTPGIDGQSAKINGASATATKLLQTADPTVSVTPGGDELNRTFAFEFGIPQGFQGPQGPQGPQGFQGQKGTDGTDGQSAKISGASATATKLLQTADPTVSVTPGGDELNRTFAFEFGIPQGFQGPQGPQGLLGPNYNITKSEETTYLVGKSTDTAETSDISTWYVSSVYAKAGILYATDFIASSDIKFKKNISDISSDELDRLSIVKFKSFDWKSDGTHSFGVIAQELEALFPELVHDESDGKHVAYLPLLCAYCTYLKKEIELLKQSK